MYIFELINLLPTRSGLYIIPCAFLCVNIIAYVLVLLGFMSVQKSEETFHPPITVLIPFYNDANVLKENIGSFLNQRYENYHILLVNDGSLSLGIWLSEIEAKYSNVRVHHLPHNSGKKAAITSSFSGIQSEFVLATDADCVASSNFWIASMCRYIFEDNVVIGYAPMIKRSGFLNTWARYETWHTGFLYLSAAQLGIPYMAVGRNFLYSKTQFVNTQGFESHRNILSGDDDLFLQDLMEQGVNVTPNIEEDSFIYSEVQPTWKKYWRQKERHTSTSHHYSLRSQVTSGFIPFTVMCYYVSTILLCIFNMSVEALVYVLLLFIVRWLCLELLFQFPMRKLKESDLLFYVPILDIFTFVYYLRLVPGLFRKKHTW